MKNLEVYSCVLGPVSTNCYILKNKETKEVLIIDPADAPQRIIKKIDEIDGKPAAILLTHGHYDHITAAEAVKEHYQIPIYASKEEDEVLRDSRYNLTAYQDAALSLKADQLLEDLEVLDLAGFRIQMISTPGHTKGSCCYYIREEGVLFSGDTLFYCSVGRTDLPTGSTAKIKRSLHRLLESLPSETVVYPGHDCETTIGYEKRYNPFG